MAATTNWATAVKRAAPGTLGLGRTPKSWDEVRAMRDGWNGAGTLAPSDADVLWVLHLIDVLPRYDWLDVWIENKGAVSYKGVSPHTGALFYFQIFQGGYRLATRGPDGERLDGQSGPRMEEWHIGQKNHARYCLGVVAGGVSRQTNWLTWTGAIGREGSFKL